MFITFSFDLLLLLLFFSRRIHIRCMWLQSLCIFSQGQQSFFQLFGLIIQRPAFVQHLIKSWHHGSTQPNNNWTSQKHTFLHKQCTTTSPQKTTKSYLLFDIWSSHPTHSPLYATNWWTMGVWYWRHVTPTLPRLFPRARINSVDDRRTMENKERWLNSTFSTRFLRTPNFVFWPYCSLLCHQQPQCLLEIVSFVFLRQFKNTPTKQEQHRQFSTRQYPHETNEQQLTMIGLWVVRG